MLKLFAQFPKSSVLGLVLVGLLGSSCKSKDATSSSNATTAAVKATGASAQNAPKGLSAPGKPEIFSIPVGPKLGIFPGQGIGPVRFGATLQTIERLMEAPCTEKTETLCRYAAHAVDFHLQDGVLIKLQIQGDERPFGANVEHSYGIFNGQFPQGAALGMYSHVVIGMLGEPKRQEKVSDGKTVERHFYPDAVLEYDTLKNGNVVLSSVILEKPAKMKLKPAPTAE